MSVTITTPILNEEGNGKFSGTFTDSTGALVTPDKVFYSVVDSDGLAYVAETELEGFTTSWEVELCGSPALSLSALETDDQIPRFFFIRAEYGVDPDICQDTNEAKFWIKNLKGITAT
jgi:hypothetical protein